MQDELNYKQAYYYLCNKITDIIETLTKIQRNAEELCIAESIPSDTPQPDAEQALKNMAEYVMKNME